MICLAGWLACVHTGQAASACCCRAGRRALSDRCRASWSAAPAGLTPPRLPGPPPRPPLPALQWPASSWLVRPPLVPRTCCGTPAAQSCPPGRPAWPPTLPSGPPPAPHWPPPGCEAAPGWARGRLHLQRCLCARSAGAEGSRTRTIALRTALLLGPGWRPFMSFAALPGHALPRTPLYVATMPVNNTSRGGLLATQTLHAPMARSSFHQPPAPRRPP